MIFKKTTAFREAFKKSFPKFFVRIKFIKKEAKFHLPVIAIRNKV